MLFSHSLSLCVIGNLTWHSNDTVSLGQFFSVCVCVLFFCYVDVNANVYARVCLFAPCVSLMCKSQSKRIEKKKQYNNNTKWSLNSQSVTFGFHLYAIFICLIHSISNCMTDAYVQVCARARSLARHWCRSVPMLCFRARTLFLIFWCCRSNPVFLLILILSIRFDISCGHEKR